MNFRVFSGSFQAVFPQVFFPMPFPGVPFGPFQVSSLRPKMHSNTKLLFSGVPKIRKILLVSVKFLSATLGPEMAAPILWTPGKMRPLCRKNHVHKILLVLGGGTLGFGGGWRGSADFYFYGREDFSDKRVVLADVSRYQKTGTRVHSNVPLYQKPE